MEEEIIIQTFVINKLKKIATGYSLKQCTLFEKDTLCVFLHNFTKLLL